MISRTPLVPTSVKAIPRTGTSTARIIVAFKQRERLQARAQKFLAGLEEAEREGEPDCCSRREAFEAAQGHDEIADAEQAALKAGIPEG